MNDISAVASLTGTVRSGDVAIFYRLFGTPGKIPLVIVHGLSFFSYDWIEAASALARDRQVAAGHDVAGDNLPAFLDEVRAFLDARGG